MVNKPTRSDFGIRQCIGIALAFAALLIATGCGVKVNVYQQDFEPRSPRTVAVLPFSSEKSLPEGKRPDFLLRKVFFNHFSYLGYTDLPMKVVDQRLKQAGLFSMEDYNAVPAQKLRDALNVDAVIRGHILDANNFTGGIYSETRIKARLDMLDLRTGEKLWDTEHHEFTTSGITTLTLVDIVTEQIDNTHVEEAYHNIAERFVLKLLKQIPDPSRTLVDEGQLPKITRVAGNWKLPRVLKPYEVIQLKFFGDPGLKGFFDIGSQTTGIAMKETTPGYYVGNYQIKEEDHFAKANLIACLKNADGLVGKKIIGTVSTQKVESVAKKNYETPKQNHF